MSLRLFALTLLVFFALAQSLPACSVPVFRYALERWTPDLFEVSVFYRGILDEADARRLDQLEDLAIHNGGRVNWEVVRCNLDERVPADLLALWKSLKDAPLPTVVVRTPRKGTAQSLVWHGRLSDAFLDGLSRSSARREIVQRLLRGDAVVWVLLRGTDRELAARAKETLDTAIDRLAEQIELPAGVGRPGSELLAKIPLHMKFSVVEISADSREEQALIKLLQAGMAKPLLASESYLAPVFGRGRVLDVLSARDSDSETITDFTRYLCGACSCQVKQQNPGFDLLCEVNWEERLFDETFDSSAQTRLALSEDAGFSTGDADATLVAIPPGHASRVTVSPSAEIDRSSPGGHASLLVFVTLLAVAASFFVVLTK